MARIRRSPIPLAPGMRKEVTAHRQRLQAPVEQVRR
jgi:hypothetical protein